MLSPATSIRSTRLISILYIITLYTTNAFDGNTPIPRQYAHNNILSRPIWCQRFPRGGSIREEDVHNRVAQSDGNKGSSNSSSQQRASSSSSSLLPLIDTKTVSLALRLTCETNRRLYRGTIGVTTAKDASKDSDESVAADADDNDGTALPSHDMHSPYQQHHQQYPQQYYPQEEQGSGQMVSSSIPPQIPSVTEEERAEERRKEEMTIFHSIEPWKPPTSSSSSSNNASSDKSRRGISRWGPDVDKYLDTLLCSIGLGTEENDSAAAASSAESSSSTESTSSNVSTISTHTINSSKNRSPMEDERQLILSLTLLYLDHSISLDTPRHMDPHTGRPWYPPCPQILPRTVHRLVLTAIIIATKTVRGADGGGDSSLLLREAANKLLGDDETTYTVSGMDLEQMEQWMLHSLGADSSGAGGQWQISAEVVQDFMRKWSETFYPQRLLAHDERNRSRMEKLERFWREKTGAFGGGGGGHHHYNHHGQYGGDHGHRHWNNGAAADQYQQQYEQQQY